MSDQATCPNGLQRPQPAQRAEHQAKVVGLQEPELARIRFARCERDVLTDTLRDQRGAITCRAADAHRYPDSERDIDEHHDALRAVERLMMRIENSTLDDDGHLTVVGPTSLWRDLLRAGAKKAVERLVDAQERYCGDDRPRATRAQILGAASTTHAWLETLVAFEEVDDYDDN